MLTKRRQQLMYVTQVDRTLNPYRGTSFRNSFVFSFSLLFLLIATSAVAAIAAAAAEQSKENVIFRNANTFPLPENGNPLSINRPYVFVKYWLVRRFSKAFITLEMPFENLPSICLAYISIQMHFSMLRQCRVFFSRSVHAYLR